MDIRPSYYSRLAPVFPSWWDGGHERRQQDRRAQRVRVISIEQRDATPTGPSMDFMAHLLGQGHLNDGCTDGAAIYAAGSAQRYNHGICADQRA